MNKKKNLWNNDLTTLYAKLNIITVTLNELLNEERYSFNPTTEGPLNIIGTTGDIINFGSIGNNSKCYTFHAGDYDVDTFNPDEYLIDK